MRSAGPLAAIRGPTLLLRDEREGKGWDREGRERETIKGKVGEGVFGRAIFLLLEPPLVQRPEY